jgi:hypothetical protein
MKKALVKAFVIAALALSAAFPVQSQVRVKNNFNQKIKKITLSFKKPNSTDWETTVGNYWVPRDANQLRFTIELHQTVQKIRFRLELRQLCQLGVNPDIEVAREQEFFASNSPLQGVVLNGPSKIYHLIITVHPPQGGTEHPQPHCFQNPDHLGEGPYEASIWLADGQPDTSTVLDDNDTLHLTYTQSFETTSVNRFERLQAKDYLKRRGPNRGGRRRNR